MAQVPFHLRDPEPPLVIDDYERSVQHAPHDKGPSCAMPETAQKHGRHDIERLPEMSAPVSSQDIVNILAQETPERFRLLEKGAYW
jgi:hypothetical protein